jgi:hypothetical protein
VKPLCVGVSLPGLIPLAKNTLPFMSAVPIMIIGVEVNLLFSQKALNPKVAKENY